MTARKAYSQDLVEVYDHRHFGGNSGQHILARDTQTLEALLPAPPALVLDVPCGTGAYAAALRRRGYDVIAADASQQMAQMVDQRSPGVAPAVADINCLPLPDRSVDAVIVLRLFSHFLKDDVLRMLCELRRVTRPQGRIIFDTFRWSPRYWPGVSLLLEKSYIYPISDRDVETVIAAAGLTKVEARSLYLFSPIWERKLRIPVKSSTCSGDVVHLSERSDASIGILPSSGRHGQGGIDLAS